MHTTLFGVSTMKKRIFSNALPCLSIRQSVVIYFTLNVSLTLSLTTSITVCHIFLSLEYYYHYSLGPNCPCPKIDKKDYISNDLKRIGRIVSIINI